MSKRKYKNPKKGYKNLTPFFKMFFAKFGFYEIEGKGKPYYMGTKQGKVFRVTASNKLKEMKDGSTEKKYGYVKLKMPDGIFKEFAVHRLNGQFIENPENKPLVHHETGKKNHNAIDEFAWATYKENALYYQQSKKRKDWSI